MSSKNEPIKNHRLYNKAQIARALGVSRVYISKVMRGLADNPRILAEIKNHIITQSKAA